MGKFSKIIVTVPDIARTYVSGTENYSKQNIITGNLGTIKIIKDNYSKFIDYWGKVFEIDSEVIIAFIATESTGINRKPKSTYGPNGLMQVSVAPVGESIYKFAQITKNDLPAEVVNYLNKNLSSLTKLKTDILTTSQKTSVAKLLQDPEFNIMAGCLILRWLLEKFDYLNKTIVAYNAGAYTASLTKYSGREVTTADLVKDADIKSETKAYLLKMLGVYGFLYLIITSDKSEL